MTELTDSHQDSSGIRSRNQGLFILNRRCIFEAFRQYSGKGNACIQILHGKGYVHACMCICPIVSNSLRTVACQAPLSMEFFRQEYWSGFPFPLPGDLLDPGIEFVSLESLGLAGRFFTNCATLEAWEQVIFC